LNTLRNSKINRYKQTLLADPGYDTKKNSLFLAKKGYISMIKYNKRNCKNKKEINKRTFRGKQLKIYKRRSTIEASFSWLKYRPIINQLYEKSISSYKGLLLLACIILISKRT
jgi:transposase